MLVEEDAVTDENRSAPRYELIRSALRDAIIQGLAEPGLVLVEGPLAQLFATSRVPVRQALTLLHDEGLISRFEGRGYLINPEGLDLPAQRLPLTRQLLGLETHEELIDLRPLGERVYDDIAACVSTVMVFGHYRLDEQRAAEYLGVSRSVVREALLRLRDRGLVEKEPYAQWLAGPLTAREISDDYELRALLEPQALQQTAAQLSHPQLQAMLERIAQLQGDAANATREAVDQLERDLHQHCLGGLRNRKMAVLIQQCQSPMNVSRIFHDALGMGVDEATLVEHRLVIEALLHGNVDSAALSLRDHLLRARDRTLQRLKVLSVLPEPDLPPYLTRLS